jgi:ribose transport system ATP-binding protein
LSSLKKYTKFLINSKKVRQNTKKYVTELNIKAASLRSQLEFFSGGNQQKVSLAKCLDTDPKILILDEPTRGIDVNAKREIYYIIRDLVKEGVSVILISSEMEEIIGLCNRVVVMKEGRITGILEGDHINEEEIMYYATGLKGAVQNA